MKLQNDLYEYEVRDDNTVYLSKYLGQDSSITIPSEIDGKTVTVIGKYCFIGNETIKEVTISDTIETIDRFAFADCPALSLVKVSPNVDTIGKHAFLECTSLHSLKMPTEDEKNEFRAAKIRAEEEARLKAEKEEARLRAEEEARLKAEEEARIRAEEEARIRTEEEARIRAEEEARIRAEEEARIKAEQEAALRERIRAELEAELKAKAAAEKPEPAPEPAPAPAPEPAVDQNFFTDIDDIYKSGVDMESLTPVQRSIEAQKRRIAAEARDGTAPYTSAGVITRRPSNTQTNDSPGYIPAAAMQQTPPVSRTPRTQRPVQRPMERTEPAPIAGPGPVDMSRVAPRTAPRTALRTAPRTGPRTTTRSVPQRALQENPPSRPNPTSTPSPSKPSATRPNDAPITRSIFGFKKKPVYKQEREATANEWKCPECGLVNANYVTTCACGYRKRPQRKHEEDL